MENTPDPLALQSAAMIPNRALVLVLATAVACGVAGAIAPTRAQSKPVPGFPDYGKWETLGVAGGGGRGGAASGLSNNGAWLAYLVNKSNRDSELRLVNLKTKAVTAEK